MRLSDLQCVIDVAEHGSLTQAASARRMSQPGLSRIVRELENQLNARLFRRTGRGIELTPAGERFLAFARETVAGLAETRESIAALSPDRPRHFRVAVPLGMGALLAPGLQRQFALQLPQIAIDVFEERTSMASDAQLMRQYDAALTYGYDDAPPEHAEDLYREDLHWVGVADLIGDADAPVRFADVAALPLMLPPAGRYRSLIDSHFSQAGLPLSVAREFETSDAMIAYVLEREGVAILPHADVVASHGEARLSSRPIVEPRLSRHIRLLENGSLGGDGYRQMVAIIRDTLDALAGRVGWHPLRA